MNLRVLEFYLLNIKAVYLISLTSQDENFLVSIEYIEERGAVATATGGGRSPSTGVRGCNPLLGSRQQATARSAEPTRSAVLFFRGFCLFPRLRGTLKRGFQVGRVFCGFLVPGSLAVPGVFGSVVSGASV